MKLDHLANVVVRGIIPFQGQLRRLKRRLLPYQDDAANSDYCVTNGLEQLAVLRRLGIPVEGAEVLEFGSGWLPLIPLLFHMAGARRLVLTDVARLQDQHTFSRARAIVAGRVEDVAQVLDRPVAELLARLNGPFPHDYMVPWNPETCPKQSLDIVVSRAVLEHVPKAQIEYFFKHFHRILRDSGVMCHMIDNSDHWQHKDRSLSRVEFLHYEETGLVWRLAQLNEQAFQNRLRHSDYVKMIADARFRIILAEGEPDGKCLRDLERISLSTRFRDYEPRDLAILGSLIVAAKA
jgi:SAM-dependent methyltransferase